MTDKTLDFGVQFAVLDEIKEPEGMKSRLVQSHRTKSLAIQYWGSMSGQWITTQRYKDVQEMWNRSKQTAQSILDNRKKKKKAKTK